jgi:hypothetical protein
MQLAKLGIGNQVACGNIHLYAGLEAGINASLQAVSDAWDQWYATIAIEMKETGLFSDKLIGKDELHSLPEMKVEE